ncbi:hypothetical protein [Staphylococcus hominis]|nr:hypothetical protein [Staphylococcus hominis]
MKWISKVMIGGNEKGISDGYGNGKEGGLGSRSNRMGGMGGGIKR